MSDDSSPILQRRELGATLRRLRSDHGMSIETVADHLGCSVSKISRMETAARGVNERDLDRLATLFELPSHETERLRRMASSAKQRAWWQKHELPPTDFIGLQQLSPVGLEQSASEIREFSSAVVPGLLQTERYMRASMRGAAPDIDEDELREAIDFRLHRQALLVGTSRPRFDVVLDESVLRRRVGDAAIMREQISMLLDLIARGVVTMRIVPFEAGAYPGSGNNFIALRMSDRKHPDVVLVEGLIGQTTMDDSDDVQRYWRIWDHLVDVAEDSSATVERLRGLAEVRG